MKQAWLNAYRFYTKVFALTFALGVVSGVVMSFQFGTNWPGFMERAGDVAGPLLAYEVLTAFFLEAGFLGIMLFGHGKVSERVHLWATFFVAFGTTLSAFWILALNSWMQTPTGHSVVDGRFVVDDWLQRDLQPVVPVPLTHMLLASTLTCAFLLSGLSAWQLLKGSAQRSAPKVLRVGADAGRAADPAADLRRRPARAQHAGAPAAEGGGDGRPVGDHARRAAAAVRRSPMANGARTTSRSRSPSWPASSCAIELDAEIQGLNDFRDRHPPVFAVFWSFRVMVGMGVLMLPRAGSGWWLYRRSGWQASACRARCCGGCRR